MNGLTWCFPVLYFWQSIKTLLQPDRCHCSCQIMFHCSYKHLLITIYYKFGLPVLLCLFCSNKWLRNNLKRFAYKCRVDVIIIFHFSLSTTTYFPKGASERQKSQTNLVLFDLSTAIHFVLIQHQMKWIPIVTLWSLCSPPDNVFGDAGGG